MELWIRNQNKKLLIKCNNVIIDEYLDSHIDIRQYNSESGSFKLGSYESVERAKEILDEIQKILSYRIIQSKPLNTNDMLSDNQIIMNSCNTEIHDIGSYVYEMPEK